jgi:hypothetical protein
MIDKRRIRNVDTYLLGIKKGDKFYIAKKASEVKPDLLKDIGFTLPLEEGVRILAKAKGPVSRFNVNGSFERLKHLPKETKTRLAYLKDWHGNYHLVDIPYHRYQRKPIPAPEIELSVHKKDEEFLIVSDLLQFTENDEALNRHAVNLFLEYFGDCEILDENKNTAFKEIPVRRVNWEILPKGDYPWGHISIRDFKERGENKEKLQRYTYDTIVNYKPESLTVGTGGFRGYIAFHFPSKHIFLLEHFKYGNATYVFDEEKWADFSQLTKSQIINGHLEKKRIEHHEGWDREINKILK